jgi:2-hydroxychromene-2-carboxylate isomerase
MATCEFFYDFSSPFAYLGATQVQRVCGEHDVVWRPFLLGALFNEIGTPTVPLATFPAAKAQLAMKDQFRWAEHWGVRFEFPEQFPQKSVTALRLALQAPESIRGALSLSLFELMWVHNGDLNDETALRAIVERHGLDAQDLLSGTQNPEIKAKLKENTDEAVRRGICGAPSFVVGDLVFWGQDRLDFVRKALDGWIPVRG